MPKPAVYQYDTRNRMISATENGKTVESKYNGDGLRIEKTAIENFFPKTTQYMYEYDKIVLEKQGDSFTKNVHGTNLISRTINKTDTAYFMYNGHHDVTKLVNPSGAVLAGYYYDAFGNITEQTGDTTDPYTYAGYFFDSEVNLYYLKARFYDARIARFMTEDTYHGKSGDALSLNLYTYCANNPLVYYDPTGHFLLGILIGIGTAIVGGAIATGSSGGSGSGSGSTSKNSSSSGSNSSSGGSGSSSGKSSSQSSNKTSSPPPILLTLSNAFNNVVGNAIRALSDTVFGSKKSNEVQTLTASGRFFNSGNVKSAADNGLFYINTFLAEYGGELKEYPSIGSYNILVLSANGMDDVPFLIGLSGVRIRGVFTDGAGKKRYVDLHEGSNGYDVANDLSAEALYTYLKESNRKSYADALKNSSPGNNYNKVKIDGLEKNFDKLNKLIALKGQEKEYPYVDIPQDERNLGTIMSYMGWHKITATSSPQYKLREDAKSTGRYEISKPVYYAMVDGRIVIATKPNIGGMLEVSIGDYVDVTFQTKDGTISTYNCILGDFKGADAPNVWGHDDGRTVVEIIYYDYTPPDGYNNVNNPVSAGNNPWGKGNVLRITKVGSYYDK